MSLAEHEAEFVPKRGGEFQPRPTGAVKAESETAPEPEPEPVVTGDETADDTARADMERQRAEAANPALKFQEQPKPRERHRAKSQEANAGDFETIRNLSATLKEKTEAWSKLKKAEGESPRVLALKQRIRGIEADLAEAEGSKPPLTRAEPVPQPRVAPSAPSAFTEVEPSYKTFEADPGKYPDPYLAYTRAVNAYDRRKERFDEQQAKAKQDAAEFSTRTQREQAEAIQREGEAYLTRAKTFAVGHPDYFQKITDLQQKGHDIPPVVTAAIRRSDNGPELMYALARRPDVLDSLLLSNLSTPVTDATVVAMRRYLTALVAPGSAGQTGAATSPSPEPRVPRPPTPVRTGPLKTGTEPPGDGASLSDHESFYQPKRRR
jgi:hypothetical protein